MKALGLYFPEVVLKIYGAIDVNIYGKVAKAAAAAGLSPLLCSNHSLRTILTLIWASAHNN